MTVTQATRVSHLTWYSIRIRGSTFLSNVPFFLTPPFIVRPESLPKICLIHPERISNLNPPSRSSILLFKSSYRSTTLFHSSFLKLVHSFDFGDKITRQAVFDEKSSPVIHRWRISIRSICVSRERRGNELAFTIASSMNGVVDQFPSKTLEKPFPLPRPNQPKSSHNCREQCETTILPLVHPFRQLFLLVREEKISRSSV